MKTRPCQRFSLSQPVIPSSNLCPGSLYAWEAGYLTEQPLLTACRRVSLLTQSEPPGAFWRTLHVNALTLDMAAFDLVEESTASKDLLPSSAANAVQQFQ